MVYPNSRAGMEATSVDRHVDQILSRARVLVVTGNSFTGASDSCVSYCSSASKLKSSASSSSTSVMDAIQLRTVLARNNPDHFDHSRGTEW